MGSVALLTVDSLRLRSNMNEIHFDFNCMGACDWVFQQFILSPNWSCDGTPNISRAGNWKGHVFPGCIFLVWSTHWLIAWVKKVHQTRPEEYQASSTFRLLDLVPDRYPLEAIVKSTLPMLNILLELWLAHEGGYRRLVCQQGTLRQGHLIGNHVANWQHAMMYPGFIISGLTDLAVHFDPSLPPSLPLVMLSLSYLCEGLLMGMHEKHTPLDVTLHTLLTATMIISSLAPLLEAAYRKGHPGLTGLRIWAVAMQGCWFIALARILYEGRAAWDTTENSDLSPVVYVSVLFGSLSLGVLVVILFAYFSGYYIFGRRENGIHQAR